MQVHRKSGKRRKRGDESLTRNTDSRVFSQSGGPASIASGSRYSAASGVSSQGTLPSHGHRRSPAAILPSRLAGSVASSRASSVLLPQSEERNGRTTEPPPEDENDVDHETMAEVIMAVNVTDRGSVGCAYYVAQEEKLYFMEDVQLGGPHIVDNLKLFINPTVVLVSTKCNDDTIERLDPEARNADTPVEGRGDQTRLPYLLECRPNTEFAYESARNRLVHLRIGQHDGPNVTYIIPGDVVTQEDGNSAVEGGFVGRQAQLLRLSGWINMESRLTVGCVGAVLSYLQRRRSVTYLPGDHDAESMFTITTIEMFSLSGSMFINADTLLSLQITSTESHPSAQQQGHASSNWSKGSKEGFSVYGLFHDLAKTAQGRVLLRQYFLRPSLNLDVINERLDTVAALIRPDNAGNFDLLINELSNVRNMRVLTVNLRKGICSGLGKHRGVSAMVWYGLRQFLFSTLRISDILGDIQGMETLAIHAKVDEYFDKPRYAAIGQMIGDVVDFDESRALGRTVVLSGVEPALDEAKRVYQGIEDMLSGVAADIASEVPAGLNNRVNVIFFPQIGFLITIELGDINEVYPGTAEDPWEKMFASQTHSYHKNAQMTELDEHYGDIWGRIIDMEIEIVQSLGQRVLEYEDLLNRTSDICGEIDALVALARGAKQFRLVKPQVSRRNIVKISAGRHILQELTVPTFVPNDTYLVGGDGKQVEDNLHHDVIASVEPESSPKRSRPQEPSVVLLTGPNYSGKSVYLKQVAIIVYLAHVGSFVPAEAAKIGLTDKIMTRISTRESVSRIQSAFMIDLQQASMALSLATRRSLVIIDEFGKGTESWDGAGLAAGVFEHLLYRGSECPKVLGATHFHEIFESGFLPPRPALGFAHMEVNVDTTASEVDGQITYLYNYRPGRSSSSFGTVCARMNGVGRVIIERAEGLLLLAAQGHDLVEACAKLPDAELAELDEAEEIARQFLGIDRFDEPRELLDVLVSEVATDSSFAE